VVVEVVTIGDPAADLVEDPAVALVEDPAVPAEVEDAVVLMTVVTAAAAEDLTETSDLIHSI